MEHPPLFERLGGREGVAAVVEKAIANHFANPTISTRFEHASQSLEALVDHAVEFFCTGLTGVETYQGRPLAEAHAGMNVNEQEFMAVLDDIIKAMVAVGIGELERSEVLAILYSMKGDVLDMIGDPRALAAYDAAIAVAGPTDTGDLIAMRALAQTKQGDPRGALLAIAGAKPTSITGRLSEALAYAGAAALGRVPSSTRRWTSPGRLTSVSTCSTASTEPASRWRPTPARRWLWSRRPKTLSGARWRHVVRG